MKNYHDTVGEKYNQYMPDFLILLSLVHVELSSPFNEMMIGHHNVD